LTDAEWALIELMTPLSTAIGRPRATKPALRYRRHFVRDSTGCQWRQLPKDFAPHSTVQGYFYEWAEEGRFATINLLLIMRAREAAGREAGPVAGVIDSRSVKTTEDGGPRGFAAEKKINRCKRHIVTDTQGNVVGLVVHDAGVQDREGAPRVACVDPFDLSLASVRLCRGRLCWAKAPARAEPDRRMEPHDHHAIGPGEGL
jgi:putative transposase